MKTALDNCVKILKEQAVDKFQCSLQTDEKYEMNLEGTNFELIRNIKENTLTITVIHENKRGTISLNSLDEKAIEEAVKTALELAHTSQADPDYDISPKQAPQSFKKGPLKPDVERMYELLKNYSQEVPKLFPSILMMESVFSHEHSIKYFVNSNGAEFREEQGSYNMMSIFSSKDKERTTSFNHSSFDLDELERELLERASLKGLLQQSVEHLKAKPFEGKFVGDIILTPECLRTFLYYYTMVYLGDGALISGTSPLKNKLDQEVANEKFTLKSLPTAEEMAKGYFITSDGFVVEDTTLIDKGVLKSFLLSLYGSKKTGLERSKTAGGCLVVEPGEENLEELISKVEKGLLLARYSGGSPSPNGDFSGVAKNSYYIENGKIQYPVTETMVAGNLIELFKNLKEISKEQIDFGDSILPHILTTGVTISGK